MTDSAIQKAERLVYVSSDKEVLRAYQMREMALNRRRGWKQVESGPVIRQPAIRFGDSAAKKRRYKGEYYEL
ncbi:MAG: hypothetical protein LBK00_05300 [Treponema sp.]|jgi:hypothetical protein|nr:hypothetical protein [Treponema sp.]